MKTLFKILALLPALSFGQLVPPPSGMLPVDLDTVSGADTALIGIQIPGYLGGQSVKMRRMTLSELSDAIGGGGVSGQAIHDSLVAHGLGADSSAWFKSLNRVFSVGPEWGDSTPGAQVGFQRAVDSVCAAGGGGVYVPSGQYLFTSGVQKEDCTLSLFLAAGVKITVDPTSWAMYTGLKSKNNNLPNVRSPFVFRRCHGCSIVSDGGSEIDLAGFSEHVTGSSAFYAMFFESDGYMYKGLVGRNNNPTVDGQPDFGGWDDSFVQIRYDGFVSLYGKNGKWLFNRAYNTKYAVFSARCDEINPYMLGNYSEDFFEGTQQAYFGSPLICGSGSGGIFQDNIGVRPRAQCAVWHSKDVVVSGGMCFDGVIRDPNPNNAIPNCVLAIDGDGATISSYRCKNAYPITAVGSRNGAYGTDDAKNVVWDNVHVSWDSVGDNDNTIAFGISDSSRNVTINNATIRNVGVCLQQSQSTSPHPLVSINNMTCDNFRVAAVRADGRRGFSLRGGRFSSLSTSLMDGLRLNWGAPSSDSVNAVVSDVHLDFPPPSNSYVLGNTVNANITNVSLYNPMKVGRWWYFNRMGNNGTGPGASTGIKMLDSIIVFGNDTAAATRVYITKMGTRKIGSATDTATYPAIRGTHKPTVQVMGDASITVSPLTEVVVTSATLTAQRDIELQAPSVYGPNRCITVRDGGFINGSNTIGVDPGAFPIDGTPSVMGMSNPYDVLKLCTNNAADGWILEYAK